MGGVVVGVDVGGGLLVLALLVWLLVCGVVDSVGVVVDGVFVVVGVVVAVGGVSVWCCCCWWLCYGVCCWCSWYCRGWH